MQNSVVREVMVNLLSKIIPNDLPFTLFLQISQIGSLEHSQTLGIEKPDSILDLFGMG